MNMYLYTQVTLSSEDDPEDRHLAPFAILKEDIASWRGFRDSDKPAKFKRYAAITLRSGYEIYVCSTFKQIKDALDPDSDGGQLVESIDPDPPHLDFSL